MSGNLTSFMKIEKSLLCTGSSTQGTDRPKTWCVKCTPMCTSARVAPSNIVYKLYGYRSTEIGVLTTEICFSNIIWIYVLCERVLESEFKLN